MAERDKPKAPVLPFVADESAWENDLAAWDASLPIEDAPPPEGDGVGPGDLAGALPAEENPFFDTPTTAVSPRNPSPAADGFTEASVEFAETATPHSEIYASMVSSVETIESLFQREPRVEPPAPIFAEALPEMAGMAWREGLQRLISVPALVSASPPSLDESRALYELLVAEMGVADTAGRQADLTFAAARVAEISGDLAAALQLCDDALTLQPMSAAVLRSRLRLLERRGDAAEAHQTLGRLCDVVDGDERDFYRTLHAEWTLTHTGRLDPESLALFGDGPARALAEAEIALRAGEPAVAAMALEAAARGVEGVVGAALAGAAARLAEVGEDFASASRQRALAAQWASGAGDALRLPLVLGQLRDAARVAGDAEAAEGRLAELLPALPPSELRVGVARWAAALARRAGAPDRAVQRLGAGASSGGSPSLLRDRIELLVMLADFGFDAAQEAEASTALARAGEVWPSAAARAFFDLLGVEVAMRPSADRAAGERAALAIVDRALTAAPDAIPLALAAEQIGRRATDLGRRAEAFRLWARFDPARAAYASSLVVDTLIAANAAGGADSLGIEEDDQEVRAALRDLMAVAPGGAAFWALAAREKRAGQHQQAAAALSAGAEAWAGSPLAPTLQALAAIWRSDGATAAIPQVPLAREAAVTAKIEVDFEDEADVGAAAGVGVDGDGEVEVDVDPEVEGEEERTPRLRLVLVEEPQAAPAGLAEQPPAPTHPTPADRLARSPDDPAALALITLESARDPERLAQIFWAAGDAVPSGGEKMLWRLQAVLWLARAGKIAAALERALELHDADPDWAPARSLAQRLARTVADPVARARALVRSRFDRDRPAELLAVAEAFETLGDGPTAEALLRRLANGPLAIDAERGLRRLLPDEETDREGSLADAGAMAATTELAADPESAQARDPESAQARAGRFLEAARAGRMAEVIDRLEHRPPHEARASAASLYLAGLLSEGAAVPGGAAECQRLVSAALTWSADANATRRPGLLCAWRAAASDAVAAALARADAGRSPDARSVALALARAADADISRGDDGAAEARLRAAIAGDPASLPALRALRRALIARGAFSDAVAICEQEAAAMRRPEPRIRLLLLAADLARAPGRDGPGAPPPSARAGRLARAAQPLRQLLEIDPAHVSAFEQLRAIFEELDQPAALGELLARRIAVASNPFEIASLRLARAELLIGPLGDRAAGKAELAAVLHKEPQHARALGRLAELHYEDQDFAEAAELYLSRALVERSPERLREIFLRLGRIYTRHLHDAKRAADAYKRVLQLEADNREALAALSDLLIEIGETKNAIAITDRLVELESEVDKRVPYLIRLGQLWEQVGDLRQAGARLRRAADEAPRNVQAVGEMVRYFERTRDLQGRRALLDHSLLLLRADLQAGKLELTDLRATVDVLRWRDKLAPAAAGAQLIAALAPDAPARAALADWAAPPARGRRLVGLAHPEVDERLFPPGLPSGVRNIFRIIGEPLGKAVGNVKRHDLGRGDRVPRGQPPRDLIDPIAAELGVRELEVYVKAARSTTDRPGAADAALLAVEPGEPPALILGAPILALGPYAIRFAAARGLRLVATRLDLVLRGSPAETGALVAGVVRQFVSDYQHPEVAPDLMNGAAASVSRILSRRLRQEVMPFAIESASGFDLAGLYAAVRDGANRVGLLASGNLPVCLAAVLAAAGRSLTLPDLAASPEARALLDFALSDAYDDLCQVMEVAAAP